MKVKKCGHIRMKDKNRLISLKKCKTVVFLSTIACSVKENKLGGLYSKQPSGDGVRKVIEEELTAELMSDGKEEI